MNKYGKQMNMWSKQMNSLIIKFVNILKFFIAY